MKGRLLTLGLLLGLHLASASVIEWLEEPQPSIDHHENLPQGDDPAASDSVERHVHSMLNVIKGSFNELASKRNSWYDRYDDLAKVAEHDSVRVDQLLGISRVAMPIIWTTFMANHMRIRNEGLKMGGESGYIPPNKDLDEPVPHPLRVLKTSMTQKDDFKAEFSLMVNEEASIGLRLVYDPLPSEEFYWDPADFFFGIHIRWNQKKVVLVDKYEGRYRVEQAVASPTEHWPHIKVGEKFSVVIKKQGKCFMVFVITGKDMYSQEQYDFPYIHKYCPIPPENSSLLDDRPLRLVVNEDNINAGEVEVHYLAWYPITD